MKLYIGNATKQWHDFIYWVPGAKASRTQRIPIGGQIQISGELDQKAIDSIIQQHAPYGLIASSEVDHAREYIGLIYAVDSMIRSTQIQRLMVHNAEVLVVQGRETRKQASVASNEALQQNLLESGLPENLRAMEASVVEQDHDERSPEKPIAEGYRILRDNPQGPEQQPRQRRRSTRKAA